eukprot:g29505.t1
MGQTIVEKYGEARLPRYTSYPTAPNFSAEVAPGLYADWLKAVPSGQATSLYIHIPFCRSMCWYCGCHTTITEKDKPILDYLEVLHREIELVAAERGESFNIGEIHFGGGTPTIIQPEEFIALMNALRERMGFAGVLNAAVEIDPRRMHPDMAAALGQSGVTRASLGVQSFDTKVQKAINRIQTAETTFAAVEALRGNGIDAINFDLIYGLPHQTVQSCIDTVDLAVAMRPDRFAVFGYAHIPSFKKHQRLIDEAALPDASARHAQAEAIAERLVEAGYSRIGLDHFALPADDLSVAQREGRLHRNFQGYTTDSCQNLIGLGASSIGKFSQGYHQNEVPPGLYASRVSSGELPTTKIYRLTPEDRLRADVIERLMCDFRVDVAALCALHGFDPDGLLSDNPALDALEHDGLVQRESGVIRVGDEHRFVVRAVAAAFDAYLGASQRTYSKAARPRIRTALVSLMLILGLTFTAFAAFAINRMSMLNQSTAIIAGQLMPGLDHAKTVDAAFGELKVAVRNHVISGTEAGKKKAEAEIEAAAGTLLKEAQAYEAFADTEAELVLTRKIREAYAKWAEIASGLKAASWAGDAAVTEKLLYETLVPAGLEIKAAAKSLVELNQSNAAAAFADSTRMYALTWTIAVAAITIATVIIFGAVWFAVTGIAKPIQNITLSMQNLANGDTDTRVPYAGREDEIGEMAFAVEVFRTNAIEARRLEQDAASQRGQADEARRRTAEQERVRAEAMARATHGLADGLKQLAAGNLRFEIGQSFAAEFEGLRADFNAAVLQLRQTMTAVAEATTSIDGGSREVSQSADDLARRTEQQAASLEQTAAALDQITTNVANSSKRAEEARVIASQANTAARQSGAVVTSAVDAMGGIEHSSTQISSIIGVIDDIAFQTNLLALNAGVEAARAGEAGKGFAVVAQEVRELAQRSAQAAKEIKDLIRNSAAEVEKGVRLVSETGASLETIERYVITINEHMDAIAISAREQSVGLNEVNTAVNQMDQVTQQNASMVEEANAAGATLATEAARLRQLIAQFQLDDAIAAQPPQRDHRLSSPGRRTAGQTASALAVAAEKSWEEF